jgi:hypothetical protein
MSEPKVEMPGLVVQDAAELCPSGLLGKLALVSKAFRDACKKESDCRARISGTSLPPISVCLLTTANEVDWAVQSGCPADERLARALAAGGSVPALERAVGLGAPLTLGVRRAAVGSGHIHAVLWIEERGAKEVPYEACRIAALAGRLDVLQWERSRGAAWDRTTCAAAANGGHLDVLVWARSQDCEWDSITCAAAAMGGHLDVLKWAIDNGAPFDVNLCSHAASNGRLEVLKWARENGYPWNDTCSRAAEGGHLEVLKWAREAGCPWDECTCGCAALGGHLEVLKWARDNGAPWREWTCACAAKKGHLEVLKWAREAGCPWDEWTCIDAAKSRHFDVLKWAIDNGAPWQQYRLVILDCVRGTDAEGWYRALSHLDD